MKTADERIEIACSLALQFGGIDGSHHKMWVIDQMVRELCGTEEEYKRWVEKATTGVNEGYNWDEGIAP